MSYVDLAQWRRTGRCHLAWLPARHYRHASSVRSTPFSCLPQANIHAPIGEEVVIVAERFPPVEAEAGKPHVVRIVVKAHATQVSNAVVLALDTEAMQMLIVPIEANLNVFM